MNNQVMTANAVEISEEVPSDNRIDVFKLQVGEIVFGHLFLTDESYTLTWPGELDFHYIDETAHYFLFRQLRQLYKSFPSSSVQQYTTGISLVVSNNLHKFTFNGSRQPHEYRTLLEEPDSISFARYDFHFDPASKTYSFSAENYQGDSSDDGELAVLLPRSEVMAKGLFRWVLKNHTSFRKLRLMIDLHNSYGALVKMITEL